jgi:uncharacterized protein (DUF2461 family)
MTFTGFDPAAVALLGELPSWSPDEFEAHKRQLHDGINGPGRALITDLAARLDAELAVDSRTSVSPLHRDLRFAPAGSARYKDHLLLTTWEGADKKTSPTLWIRIDARRVGFASGLGFTPTIRERWRAAVAADNGATLATALDGLVERQHAEIAGQRTKNVPSPFGTEHPRGELLRLIGFQVRFTNPLPATIATPGFADWCAERLEELLPVHRSWGARPALAITTSLASGYMSSIAIWSRKPTKES